jgi:uncharacterized protein YegP (UPF0339 family)
MGKFQIKKRSNDEFQFNLTAPNGEIILTSEGYKNRTGCETGIASVKKNADDDKKYERLISKNNKHYFNLKAGNGEIIGTSEMYESIESRDGGIDSVRRNAPVAVIDDQTK